MTNTADRIALARENLRNAQVEAWYARHDGPVALERAEDDLAAAHQELRDATSRSLRALPTADLRDAVRVLGGTIEPSLDLNTTAWLEEARAELSRRDRETPVGGGARVDEFLSLRRKVAEQVAALREVINGDCDADPYAATWRDLNRLTRLTAGLDEVLRDYAGTAERDRKES